MKKLKLAVVLKHEKSGNQINVALQGTKPILGFKNLLVYPKGGSWILHVPEIIINNYPESKALIDHIHFFDGIRYNCNKYIGRSHGDSFKDVHELAQAVVDACKEANDFVKEV